MTKKTIPYSIAAYLVPNTCEIIPLVGGTVDNQSAPNNTPNPIATYDEVGKIKNNIITIPRAKYIKAKIIFLLFFPHK